MEEWHGQLSICSQMRCIVYDACLHFAQYEIEGEIGRIVERLLAGLPFDSALAHQTEGFGAERW